MSIDSSTFTDPSQLTSDQINQLDQQATQLNQASQQGYGVAINPQLATEALMTQSTAPISYQAALGDPSLQGVISSQPVGDSQFTAKSVPPPNNLFQSPVDFNPSQYQNYVQIMKNNDMDNSFESMGEAPMANLGWMNSIFTGDPATVKKWQAFLASKGFYQQYDQNGNIVGKGAVDGYDSPDFQNAFKQWATAYFLPQALFSRDPQEQMTAEQFLSGLNIDVSALAQTMSYNPAQRTKVVDAWLQAQGPDGGSVHALDAFANHFGSSALPDQLNHLRGDGLFGSIGSLLGHVPGIGNILGTTPEDLEKKLTPAEQQAMAPVLQNAHNNTGFLGTIGGILSLPSKVGVTAGMFFGDALHGKIDNPFDSAVQGRVQKFVDDPLTEMFGANFAKENPFLHTIGNIVMNVADDPLTYLPIVGEVGMAEKIGKGAEDAAAAGRKTIGTLGRAHLAGSLRTQYMGRALRPTSVWDFIKNPDLKRAMATITDPFGSAQQDVARMFTRTAADGSPLVSHGMARRILNDYSEESTSKVDDLLKVAKTGDPAQVLAFLRDPANGWAHKLIDLGFLSNRNEYHKILNNFDKLSQGKALHIWNTTHMQDHPGLVSGRQPAEAMEAASNLAMTAGMDAKSVADFEDKFWHASVDDWSRGRVFNEFMDAVKQKMDSDPALKGIAAWKQKLYSRGAQRAQKILYAVPHEPGAEGVNLSTRKTATRFTKDVEGGPTAKSLNNIADTYRLAIQSTQQKWSDEVNAAARAIGQGAPLSDDLRKQAIAQSPQLRSQAIVYDNIISESQKALTDMEEQFGGKAGGVAQTEAAPLLASQTHEWYHMPYTASEVMAYKNPALRNLELFQRRLPFDNAMKVWKMLVLAKPSTYYHILVGDETSRFHINLLLNDPETWLNYTKSQFKEHGADLEKYVQDMPPDLAMNYYALIHSGVKNFQVFNPGDGSDYLRSLSHLAKNHYGTQQVVKTWGKAVKQAAKNGEDWNAAGRQAIEDFLADPTNSEAQTLRQMVNIKGVTAESIRKDPNFEPKVESLLSDFRGFSHFDPNDKDRQHVINWMMNGNVNEGKFKELEQKQLSDPSQPYLLPQIQGRPAHIDTGQNWPSQQLDRWHEWQQAHITKARARGWYFQYQRERKRIRSYYDNVGSPLDEPILSRMANQSASQWVKKNTYQGARSAAGSELRSVAPFWGATTNADKFYLRTMVEHPEVAFPALQGLQGITQAEQQPGGLEFSIPGSGWLLSKLGMASGDSMSFDPFSAFFLTREGLGGFMPGMGPVFNFAMNFTPQGVQDGLAQFPGMQYISQGNTMLPWAEEVLSGLQQVTGVAGGQGIEAPFLGRQTGYYQKKIDEKLRQMEADWEQSGRKGQAPTIQDAERDLGVQRLGQGVAGFLSPFGIYPQNDTQNEIYSAEQEWDPNMTADQKQQFFDKYSQVADYFRYLDPGTPEQPTSGSLSKAEILQRSPWVEAYTTGTGISNVSSKATIADTQAQYKADVESGAISTMDPVAYLTKVRQREETDQAWNSYDRLQASYQQYLQETGAATSSPQVAMWKKENYDPVLQALVQQYPDWGNQFVKQTSTTQPGLDVRSEPFYSAESFNVLPFNQALETSSTVLWRAALIRQQQAVSALQQVIQAGGPQSEKDLILNGLAQQLDQLAQQDPTFASQISRYRYSSLDDLLTYQAQQKVNMAQGYPA